MTDARDLIGDLRNQQVLDVGCGTERYCELLANRGAKVVGIDPSSKMLEYSRRKITSSCEFERHLGRIENANFPSSHFNVVALATNRAFTQKSDKTTFITLAGQAVARVRYPFIMCTGRITVTIERRIYGWADYGW